MKKITKIAMLSAITLVFAVATSKAQIVVSIRPPHPVYVRPVAPSPRHVWVGEEYVVRGGRYVYRPGYWALPPHPGAIWIAGHWDRRPGGEVWIGGHWR